MKTSTTGGNEKKPKLGFGVAVMSVVTLSVTYIVLSSEGPLMERIQLLGYALLFIVAGYSAWSFDWWVAEKMLDLVTLSKRALIRGGNKSGDKL